MPSVASVGTGKGAGHSGPGLRREWWLGDTLGKKKKKRKDVDTLDINHFSAQERQGRLGEGERGGEAGGGRRRGAKEAESTRAGYRITQIILPQRSIPQELFAAWLLHKSGSSTAHSSHVPVSLWALVKLSVQSHLLWWQSRVTGTGREGGHGGGGGHA